MSREFIVTRKLAIPKEDRYVTMTIRIEREVQEEFGKLADRTGYSRNALMGKALRYALERLNFQEGGE